MKGRPDSLHYLPELHGATDQLLLPISEAESHYARSHLIESHSSNIYQDYFKYVYDVCGLQNLMTGGKRWSFYYGIPLQFACNVSTWLTVSIRNKRLLWALVVDRFKS